MALHSYGSLRAICCAVDIGQSWLQVGWTEVQQLMLVIYVYIIMFYKHLKAIQTRFALDGFFQMNDLVLQDVTAVMVWHYPWGPGVRNSLPVFFLQNLSGHQLSSIRSNKVFVEVCFLPS